MTSPGFRSWPASSGCPAWPAKQGTRRATSEVKAAPLLSKRLVRRQSALTRRNRRRWRGYPRSGTRIGGDVGRVSCCRPWELFPFLTNRTDLLGVVEAEHRQDAVVKQAIRDLKDHALAYLASGHYFANAAWPVIVALAHNLACWTQTLACRTRSSGPSGRGGAGCSASPAASFAQPDFAQPDAGHCDCQPAGPDGLEKVISLTRRGAAADRPPRRRPGRRSRSRARTRPTGTASSDPDARRGRSCQRFPAGTG
jgi:hypothetical protein